MENALIVLTIAILVGAPLWSFRRSIEAKLRGVSVHDLLQMKIDQLESRVKSRQHQVVGTPAWVRSKLYAMSATTLLFVLITACCYFGGVSVVVKYYTGAGVGVLVAWIYAAFDIWRGVRRRQNNDKLVRVEF